MVLRVVPEELARVVSLADECSATVGSVSVEPGSGGDLGPGVLVAAAGAAGADQIAGGVKYAMSALAETDESSATSAHSLMSTGAGVGAGARAGQGRGGLGAGR